MAHVDTPLETQEGVRMCKKERPKSVTVIGWIIIVWYSLGILNMVFMGLQVLFSGTSGRSVLVISVYMLWIAILGTILVSGIGILKGYNWGRILYLLTAPIVIIFGCLWFLYYGSRISIPSILIYVPIRIILPVIFYTVVFIFLKRPAASTFLAHQDSGE
jgi:hypothetical protein